MEQEVVIYASLEPFQIETRSNHRLLEKLLQSFMRRKVSTHPTEEVEDDPVPEMAFVENDKAVLSAVIKNKLSPEATFYHLFEPPFDVPRVLIDGSKCKWYIQNPQKDFSSFELGQMEEANDYARRISVALNLNNLRNKNVPLIQGSVQHRWAFLLRTENELDGSVDCRLTPFPILLPANGRYLEDGNPRFFITQALISSLDAFHRCAPVNLVVALTDPPKLRRKKLFGGRFYERWARIVPFKTRCDSILSKESDKFTFKPIEPPIVYWMLLVMKANPAPTWNIIDNKSLMIFTLLSVIVSVVFGYYYSLA